MTTSNAENTFDAVGLDRPSLQEVVSLQIREAILSGQLLPGERLIEDRLAHQLGVSRNPVREAILTLAATGLVTVSPRRGASVARVSAAEAAQLFEVRVVLDGLAARLAARNHDPVAIDEMKAEILHQRNAELGLPAGHDEEITVNRFHVLVGRASGNPYLLATIEPLGDKTRLVLATVVNQSEPSWEEHAAILDAIVAGDEDRADELARLHMYRARAAFLGGDTSDQNPTQGLT
ncbi:MAG: GntR family transcriptional regulator [Acidimicrobiia bacterium]|nr:MAG: GntR family transcriptional regulator [Acidimicrobiia bacterium]